MSPENAAVATPRSRSQDGAAPKKSRRDNVRMLRYSRLPRALSKHVGPEADAYRHYALGLVERVRLLLPLPAWAVEPIRECGHAFIDLQRLRADLEALHARRGGGVRRQEERKLRGEIRKTRISLLVQERQLEKLAKGNGHTPTVDELLDRVDQAWAKDKAAMKRAGDG